jgi:hypothetical protein
MHQPEGYNDSSSRVCHLIKTLYGLKQSGREWNTKFDGKMRKKGYKCLPADPCVYTRSHNDKTTIITIWVNDLLLFANTDQVMAEMKSDIQAK